MEKQVIVQNQLSEINDTLMDIASSMGAYDDPRSWAETQAYLRAGRINRFFKAKDQANVHENGIVTAESSGEGISGVAIDKDTFLAAVGGATGTYEFDFNGAGWGLNGHAVRLEDYGITVAGTFAAGDAIIIHYTSATAVYDVAGIDQEQPVDKRFKHVLTLMRKDVLMLHAIDPAQYLYVVTADKWPNGMPAGTYNIISDHGCYNGTTAEDGTFQLTTTKVIPVGGGIRHLTMGGSATEYSKDRSAGNHRVLMSILSRCFQDGTHLTISYEPCEDENYSRQAMVEVHGKHFLLLFIHPEDALETEFYRLMEVSVTSLLLSFHEQRDEVDLEGIALYTGEDTPPCFISRKDCFQLVDDVLHTYAYLGIPHSNHWQFPQKRIRES